MISWRDHGFEEPVYSIPTDADVARRAIPVPVVVPVDTFVEKRVPAARGAVERSQWL